MVYSMVDNAENRSGREAFDELLQYLGGPVVLQTILDEAETARGQGLEGSVFSDACEGEQPIVMIAARADDVEFTIGDGAQHILPLTAVAQWLSEALPAESS